jgi:hypothetical protein
MADMRAVLLAPLILLRSLHIVHTWRYSAPTGRWNTHRACTHPGCAVRERIERDDWGVFWINDNEGEISE